MKAKMTIKELNDYFLATGKAIIVCNGHHVGFLGVSSK